MKTINLQTEFHLTQKPKTCIVHDMNIRSTNIQIDQFSNGTRFSSQFEAHHNGRARNGNEISVFVCCLYERCMAAKIDRAIRKLEKINEEKRVPHSHSRCFHFTKFCADADADFHSIASNDSIPFFIIFVFD